MRAPGLAEGSTVTGDGAARGRSSTWRRMVAYAAPVVVIALYGALWIGLHEGGGRSSTHTFFQSLALAETVVALLLRRRKPVGALAGILAVYLVFALDPLLLPAVLFALLTVAMERDLRTAALAAAATAAAIGAWPFIDGRTVSFGGYILPRLAAVGIAFAAGTYLRLRRPACAPERGLSGDGWQPRRIRPRRRGSLLLAPTRPARPTTDRPADRSGCPRLPGVPRDRAE